VIDLDPLLAEEASAVEAALEHRLPPGDGDAAPRLVEAMRYSLLGGGKRLRPVLCLWVHDAAGAARDEAVWNAACALEMIHTYSLIHDDLPAMDDDDLRRGQASCHRRFDEATAVLAGDTLQTEAFGLLAAVRPPELAVRLGRLLSEASGRHGMASGQQFDLEATGHAGDMLRIHRLKTGRLLGAAAAMGAACAGVEDERVERIREAGVELGVAFQMVDDVLDVTVSAEELGKSAGKDPAQGKLTAVGELGVEGAREDARRRLGEAVVALERSGVADDRVRALALRLVERGR